MAPVKDPLRVQRGSINGKKSAARLTPEQHAINASVRGNIVLRRYGTGYYSALGKLSARKKRG